jgi:hypothetical protein
MTTPTDPPLAAGAGDRWLAGELLPGVAFAPRERVAFARGSRAGERATVLLLVAVSPEPLYHVVAETGAELHVRQSALRGVDG